MAFGGQRLCCEVRQNGSELSSRLAPASSNDTWLAAVVPGTVLTTLVHNGIFPDPFYGLNNQQIPDIHTAGRDFYTFWFCTSFELPGSPISHLTLTSRVWLEFCGINYSAEIYVNGFKVAETKGMFLRHQADITDVVWGGTNQLAVLVHPPDHPGNVQGGGQGGDHDIAKDVTAQYVEGWDWIIPIRDRNTGIWDKVVVSVSGPAVLRDPHLVAVFQEEERQARRSYQTAKLHISAMLVNRLPHSCQGTLTVEVSLDDPEGGGLVCIEHVYTEDITLTAHESVLHTLRPLTFRKPRLWWPNGMGSQPLYSVQIILDIRHYGESDTWMGRFGFRDIESVIDDDTGGRKFFVNGEPLFIRGANWIVSDGMLRLSKERYNTELQFHADMNLNMMRIWGGALAERPDFYNACDELGLLVWQEFWITGDCNGRGIPPSESSWPLDHALFLQSAEDTIKMLRNHASLALWVGGNEQHPAKDINDALQSWLHLRGISDKRIVDKDTEAESWMPSDELVTSRDSTIGLTSNEAPPSALPSSAWICCHLTHCQPDYPLGTSSICGSQHGKKDDPSRCLDGSRIYIQGSLWEGFAKGNGDFRDGPYTIQEPETFFKDNFYPYAFNPEIGSVGVPVAATVRATMPIEAWSPPVIMAQPGGGEIEVPNETWTQHAYIPHSQPNVVPNQITQYGSYADLDDFCEKAQLVNYVQYRALIESWNSRMWTSYTGLLIWKTQNPWPGLRGQLYDSLLDVTGGFFGTKLAAEPIHIQYNPHSCAVEVINTTRQHLRSVKVLANIFNLDGSCPSGDMYEEIDLPAHTSSRISQVPSCSCIGISPVYFLSLALETSEGHTVSRNFYWLHKKGADYAALQGSFRERKAKVSAIATVSVNADEYEVAVSLENTCESRGRTALQGLVPLVCHGGCTRPSTEAATEDEHNRFLEYHRQRLAPCTAAETSVRGSTETSVRGSTEEADGDSSLCIAFWLQLAVFARGPAGSDTLGDGRILPVRYSDNYLSLVPGERRDVRVTFRVKDGQVPRLVLQGWNVMQMEVPIQVSRVSMRGQASCPELLEKDDTNYLR
eukprot:SM000315S11902  [mRNA]  locus=s315:76654:82974:- [translate_table: standard]